MDGCAKRHLREIELAVTIAWQTERMNREGNKLKSLDHYLKQLRQTAPPVQTAADVLATFQALVDRGAPIKIRKVETDGE